MNSPSTTVSAVEPRDSSFPALRVEAWAWFAFVGLVWIVTSLVTLAIPPASDDWYAAEPLAFTGLEILLPGAVFWRPFDVLGRVLLGLRPEWFPNANHLFTSLGHGLNAVLIVALLRRHRVSAPSAALAALVFVVSPATVPAAFSVDGATQTWSLVFGLAATLACTYPGARRAALLFVFGWCATLWKESGLGWFLAAPVFAWGLGAWHRAEPERPRSVGGELGVVLVGLLGAASYFGVRFLLLGQVALGDEAGRYSISVLDAGALARNFAVLFGSGFSAVDSLAALGTPVSPWRVGLTAALSVPLVALVLAQLVAPRGRAALALLGGASLIAAGPHLAMGAAGEMHAYSEVAFFAVSVGVAMGASVRRRAVALACVGAFVVSAVVTDAHKWSAMRRYGQSGLEVIASLVSQSAGEVTCAVHVVRLMAGEQERAGYSIYQQSPAKAAEWGVGSRQAFGWSRPGRFEFTNCVEGRPCDYSRIDERLTFPLASCLENPAALAETADKQRWVIREDGRVEIVSVLIADK